VIEELLTKLKEGSQVRACSSPSLLSPRFPSRGSGVKVDVGQLRAS